MSGTTVSSAGVGGAEPPIDRSVDRAAMHASSSSLALRDVLLVGLSFSSGMFEAIAFLSFGKVFTAFQTGNIVFLGVGVGGTRPPFGPDPVRVVISLVAFAVGAALATWILSAFNGDEEIEDSEIPEAWPRKVTTVLYVVLALQIAFLVVWLVASPSSAVSNWSVGLNALAMGLQMNAIRSMHVPAVSTTAATATFITLWTGLAGRTLKARPAARLVAVLVSMAVGAWLGDVMLSHAHTYAPVVPVAVIAVVIVIAFSKLHTKPSH
jgi:uncharacterized membrane protein YoaK (UPF0700 family)